MMKLPLNVDFTGKVVVVTGAGGVLCGEMARAYAQRVRWGLSEVALVVRSTSAAWRRCR